jgi:GrxC family glutaredoxin
MKDAMASAKVEMYTKWGCPYCVAAKALLDSKGVQYSEYDITMGGPKREEMLARAPNAMTVPQIFIGAVHVGGSDDLHALERAGKEVIYCNIGNPQALDEERRMADQMRRRRQPLQGARRRLGIAIDDGAHAGSDGGWQSRIHCHPVAGMRPLIRRTAERKRNSLMDQKFIDLFDRYTHGGMSRRDFLDRLSALAGRSAATRTAAETEAARRELAALGNSLYRDLIPEPLKAEYGKTIRTKFAGKALLITSDEPWIPWEMVRPAAVDETTGDLLYDDPPLCEMFRLSRWLTGRGAPDQLRMKEGAWVAPSGSAPEAEAENRYFQELHRRQWQVRLSGPLQQVAEVQARLEARGVQLWHFACHGNFDAANPENSMLKLADGYFSPHQIDTRARASLTAAKPLVFLNACHAGEIGFALTGAGGWAMAFFQAGAGALIGSQWEINGKLAARFAQEFYNRLWGVNEFEGRPQPLGQAFHEARLVIKALDEANPTWLAYVLYGDPYGEVVLGG